MKRQRNNSYGKYSQLAFNELVGPVKEVMEIAYKAHGRGRVVLAGKIELGDDNNDQNFIRTFNEQGVLLSNKQYNLHQTVTTIFNEHGKQIFNTQTKRDGTLINSNTHAFDPSGLLCLSSLYRNEKNEVYIKIEYSYTKEGKHKETIRYVNGTDEISDMTVREYDERGDNVLQKQYKNGRNLFSVTELKYNDKHWHIESVVTYADEQFKKSTYRQEFMLDAFGNHVGCKNYQLDGTHISTSQSGNQYDSEGKPVEHEEEDPLTLREGETEERELDKRGNWIKKTTFYNKVPVNIFVRKLIYFDDKKQSKLVHPASKLTEEDDEEEFPYVDLVELEEEQTAWVVETPSENAEVEFPLIRHFVALNNDYPSLLTYVEPYIEVFALKELIQSNMGALILHDYTESWYDNDVELQKFTLFFSNGYLLQVTEINECDESDYQVPTSISFRSSYDDRLYLGDVMLFRPSDASGKRNMDFEEELSEYVYLCSLHEHPDKPTIQTIEMKNNNFAMSEYPVQDNFEIKDLEVNYGYGFKKFHEELMGRLNNTTKGLVLFHGQPGTGKTFYIRHLLRSLATSTKIVVYMPPNMVDHLVDPEFMTFLSSTVKRWSATGNTCVLLIEDAEPLLAKRQEGVRIQGVTNLLNLTDGLLNDMLKLQIICTFNVDLQKLDSALLRPGRLIARKEFTALSELDANLLASRLGIKHHFKKPATLGEIYALRKDANTLIHEVESDRDASDMIDDL